MPNFVDIPGLPELWTHTQGDDRVCIAILDGSADLDRVCFQGSKLTKAVPYWSEEVGIDPEHLELYLDIESSGDSEEAKAVREAEAIPDTHARGAIHLATHATHVASVLFGQQGSPVTGIAPHCTGITIPIEYDTRNFLNPLNIAHAITFALEQGAHIIHVAACHPTQTGVAHEMLEKAVRQCLERNVLLVSPAGNDRGECWCLPAFLPDVLVVGAMKDSGEPFQFSNWGGRYQHQGILAPGENIWGAQVGTDQPVKRKGTSCAAPVVTGIAALLMSLQLKQGMAPDAEAVRAALLNSAIPCDPAEVEEPERCLLGRLNVAGAYGLLHDRPLAAIVPSSSPESESEIVQSAFLDVAASSDGIAEVIQGEREAGIEFIQPSFEGAVQDSAQVFAQALTSDLSTRTIDPTIQTITTQTCTPQDIQKTELLDATGQPLSNPDLDPDPRAEIIEQNSFVAAQPLPTPYPSDATAVPSNETPDIPNIPPALADLAANLSALTALLQPSLLHPSWVRGETFHSPGDWQNTGWAASPQRLAVSNALGSGNSFGGGVQPSIVSNLVYALGTLGYDFGTEARRDSYKQLMPAIDVDGTRVPANPYDPRQMVDYLEQNLAEAKSLIWTFNLELTPVYALEPQGAFASDIYGTFQQLLAGQIEPEDSDFYIERVSMPGRLTDRTLRLFSGQVVPVVEVDGVRGIYGWKINTLVDAALASVRSVETEAQDELMHRSLSSFLNRIYYDLRNLGKVARDRALNFAATNAFQAAITFADAIASGMQLDSIDVEKSPFCRLNSDCWDVKLKFFDPENLDRAKRVYRFTIDVVDILPVTLGEVRSWAVPD